MAPGRLEDINYPLKKGIPVMRYVAWFIVATITLGILSMTVTAGQFDISIGRKPVVSSDCINFGQFIWLVEEIVPGVRFVQEKTNDKTLERFSATSGAWHGSGLFKNGCLTNAAVGR